MRPEKCDHTGSSVINKPSYLYENSGYALYTVLIILSIVTIFISLTIRAVGFTQKLTSLEIQKKQAWLLAQSGITRAEYFLNGGDGHSVDWETEKFEESVKDYGSILLKNRRFGLFSKIESQGIRLKTKDTIAGIAGRDIPHLLGPLLTLSGHVGGLVLYNNSSIEGQVVLHHGDIYRERRGRPLSEYQSRLIIRESPKLPFDSLQFSHLFERLVDTHASLLSSGRAVTGSLYINSINDSIFMHDTIVVYGDCHIATGIFIGKVIVITGILTLRKNAVIQLCQLFAEKIAIEEGISESSVFYSSKGTRIKGGIHNSQFFSQDTLYCNKEAHFYPMTVLACMQSAKNDSTVSGGIIVENGTNVNGTVITCRDSTAKKILSGPAIIFGKGCSLTGVAITDYDIDLQDIRITGHVWARSIATSDSGKSYTNFLINSIIERPMEPLFFPLIGELPVRVTVKSVGGFF